MRPAAGLDNPSASEQSLEPGIAVGVDDAAEVLQMRLRMLALAIGRIEEQGGRRPRAGEWPLLAKVPNHLERAWPVTEGLSHLVADFAQRAAATGTGARCGMPQILSGQMFRQRTSRRLVRLGRGLDCCGDDRRSRRQPFRLVGLQ